MSDPARKMQKVWLREPRRAWCNDGGEIPRGLRRRVRREGTTVVIDNPLQRVRKGSWIVLAGESVFGFTHAEMKRLYSNFPMKKSTCPPAKPEGK